MPSTPLRRTLRNVLVQTGTLPYVDYVRHHLKEWRTGTAERPRRAHPVAVALQEVTGELASVRTQLHEVKEQLSALSAREEDSRELMEEVASLREQSGQVRTQLSALAATLSGKPLPADALREHAQRRIAELTLALGRLQRMRDEGPHNAVMGAGSHLLMLPDPELMQRAVGVAAPDFLVSGQEAMENLLLLLTRVGKRLEDFESILDFGCGSARVARFYLYYGARNPPTGVDVDARPIEYCQRELHQLGRWERIPEYPPTQLEDGAFDLVYSISTFTHFREDMQHAWMAELRRVTRPGAILVLTFHNQHSERHIPEQLLPEYRKQGFVFVQGVARSEHNPDYYHAAFHTHDYVRRVWGQYFDVVDIVPRIINNNQDAAILRRRD